MNILVTGSAGFIGSALTIKLLKLGHSVVGIDNHNAYYDPNLKQSRVDQFLNDQKYIHLKMDIENTASIISLFNEHSFDVVVNLAAQAGVRYSIENPMTYVRTNIVGFANILEGCRHSNVKHLVYASSSSVYGSNTKMPFSIHHNVDHPLSLYAASKKTNELMAHTYSHLYGLPSTGLRFFTVYGPWGRPDMALFSFTKAILNRERIKVFNYGKHRRDFTYIDDIVEGLIRVIKKPPEIDINWNSNNSDPGTSSAPWRVYNIGNNKPVELLDYISAIEDSLGIKAIKDLLPLQPGDVKDTYADVSELINDFGFKPKTSVKEGVNNFIDWYKKYHSL